MYLDEPEYRGLDFLVLRTTEGYDEVKKEPCLQLSGTEICDFSSLACKKLYGNLETILSACNEARAKEVWIVLRYVPVR